MSNIVVEQITFMELIKRHSERVIPWCNMTCKQASILVSGYYWSGKYSDFKKIIARRNESELLFECMTISKNKRIKEIEAMGYKIKSVCQTWNNGQPEKYGKIYFIAKRA